MFSRSLLENVLFLDMETVSASATLDELPERLKENWEKKSEVLQRRNDEKFNPQEYYEQRAAIYAEFGKPVCVSVGSVFFTGDMPAMRLKSFFGFDERQILNSVAQTLAGFEKKRKDEGKEAWLCAHNGKEFDFPYLCRRFIINGMPLPPLLCDLQGKKPWEVKVLDTMELWRFGDYKAFTSLDLLTAVLGIPSPKCDMNGSDVGRVFWQDKDCERIARYCEEDVIATAQVMLRYSGQELLTLPNIRRL